MKITLKKISKFEIIFAWLEIAMIVLRFIFRFFQCSRNWSRVYILARKQTDFTRKWHLTFVSNILETFPSFPKVLEALFIFKGFFWPVLLRFIVSGQLLIFQEQR